MLDMLCCYEKKLLVSNLLSVVEIEPSDVEFQSELADTAVGMCEEGDEHVEQHHGLFCQAFDLLRALFFALRLQDLAEVLLNGRLSLLERWQLISDQELSCL